MSVEYLVEAVARTPQSSGPPTFVDVGPIAYAGLSWSDELNRPGDIQFSCVPADLEPDVRERFRDLAATPTEIRVTRIDGSASAVVARGEVRTRLIQGGSMSVTCAGLLGYLQRMGFSSTTTHDTDQFTIVKTLVDNSQARSFGDYGIDTSEIGLSGVTREATFDRAEMVRSNVLEQIQRLGEADNGFDIWVEPETRVLRLASPARGADLTDGVFIDARNITSPNEAASIAPSVFGTVARGSSTAADPDTAPLFASFVLTSARNAYGDAVIGESHHDIVNQTTLNSHAIALLNAKARQLFTPGPEWLPVLDADVGDFQVGDTIRYAYNAGLGDVDTGLRVTGLRVNIDGDTGVESLSVEFG